MIKYEIIVTHEIFTMDNRVYKHKKYSAKGKKLYYFLQGLHSLRKKQGCKSHSSFQSQKPMSHGERGRCLRHTHTALGSEKTSVWMCIIKSPPAAYSITKQTCSFVWKHAKRFTRKGCLTLFTVSKILFSHIRL